MKLHGRALRFGDNVNTDYIIADHYKAATSDVNDLARYVFVDFRPDFAKLVRPGDLLVAGRNFGCGSAREAAPRVLKAAGISCVLATSFARIFFRNAINIGLPVLETDTAPIAEGDELDVDIEAGRIDNLTRASSLYAAPMPAIMTAILRAGGLVEYMRRHGDLVLPEHP
ncbi:MAG TPA: 3-isopropylmalate dehydratase small subunit [Burkholderiales bacterium]|nr:3-isopropylmalate dehydratase small subunit [Burkholderiales bacterium]